jgi:beta-carotene 15,15'-dioxygenase
LVFAVIFKVGSLIWGFALYFIFWHSIPSLNDQIRFIYGNYSFNNFKLYLKSALAYWLISLLGIVIVSFLAAITFPHAYVILKMFKK